MIKYRPSVSCDINNVTGIKYIVKTCSVKKTTITSSTEDVCIRKPPLPTNVFHNVNTPISYINTMDIDYLNGSSSYGLKDVGNCSTIPCENTPSVFLIDDNLNDTYVPRDSRTSCQFSTFYNKRTHPSFLNLQPQISVLLELFWKCAPPWMFLPLDVPFEYWIELEHATFGPLMSCLYSLLGHSLREF